MGLNPNTLSANLNASGFTIWLTMKYATTHLIGHIMNNTSTVKFVVSPNIAGIMKLIIKLMKNAGGFHNPVFMPILYPKVLSANPNPIGCTACVTSRYATIHLMGHIKKQISTGIPVGIEKIKGITILIIKLMKNATGFQSLITQPPFFFFY